VLSRLPAVSVIVATYNRAKLLRETIDSILQQRFHDYELIVVDDGSTDNTRAMLEGLGSRIRYFYQENRGPSAARNAGVRHAVGRWISIQDSDDLCAPNHLECLYGYVKDHPHYGMVFANGGYLGGSKHDRETIIPTAKSRRLANRGVQLADLFDKSIVRLQAALISKAAYEAAGGHDENLRICMDLDLAFRLFMNSPVSYVDEVVFFYRKHEGNSSRNEELRLTENIRVIEKLLAQNKTAGALLGEKRVAARLAYRYYRLAKGRRKHGQRSEARSAIRQASRLRPLAVKYQLYRLRWAFF
jgi:glycosyltransferase involved in cell wall biosynthesis